MPISASAKKSLRVAKRQALENRTIKVRVKNQIKRASAETIPATFSILDKAAKNGVIHKNKAARLKSRLSKQLTVTTPPKAPKPKRSASKKSA